MEPTSVTKAMILIGSPQRERSRETILSVDRGDRPHYLAIYGGKLTTYRATAECVMQRVFPVLPGRGPLPNTRNITPLMWTRKPSIIR